MQATVTLKMTVNEVIDLKHALTAHRDYLMEMVKPMHADDGKAVRQQIGRVNDLLSKFNIAG